MDFTFKTPQITLRLLKLLKKITAKYEYSVRSDELYTEIILVCDDSHDFLYQLAEVSNFFSIYFRTN
jgi:hypothetical protein